MEWARDGDGHEADLEFMLEFVKTEIERRERSQLFSGGLQSSGTSLVLGDLLLRTSLVLGVL